MLGSELEWGTVGVGVSTGLVAAAGGTDRVYMVAITTDGALWWRASKQYTGQWQGPAGCADFLECNWDFHSSQKATTEWEDWHRLMRRTFALRRPTAVADRAGVVHVFAARSSPDVGVSHLVFADGTFTDAPFAPAAGLTPMLIHAVVMGGDEGVAESALLVEAEDFLGTFRLFQLGLSPALPPAELTFPVGVEQRSFTRSSLSAFGTGNHLAAISLLRSDGWMAMRVHLGADGRIALDGQQLLSNVPRGGQPPQLLSLPGNYLITVFQDTTSNHLFGSFGLVFGDGVLLPGAAFRFTTESAAEGAFHLFRHHNDVLVLARSWNGSAELHRLDVDDGPAFRFKRVGRSIRSPSATFPPDVLPVLVDREIYGVTAEASGDVRWINIQRRVTRDQADDYRLHPRVNPNLGSNASELLAYSDFGVAFRAVPSAYRELFRVQPASRCNPVGFTPPLVCGEVYLDFNDLWQVGAPAGRFETLEDMHNRLLGPPPDRDNREGRWQFNVLKTFPGTTILKSYIKWTEGIFHEMMHLVDFDVVNGGLLPAVGDPLRAEYARLFGDRRGATNGDGVRAPGFVTDYAESNAGEDWADSGMSFRFRGETFRRLAASDAAMGDTRLQQKYDFLRTQLFHHVEYTDEGTPR